VANGQELIGRKITAVVATPTAAQIVSESVTLRLTLDAGCCSESFFTSPAQFNELVGSTVLAVEERSSRADGAQPVGEDCTQDCMSWHFLVFVTDLGHITIDWRNDSNGYYDGNLCWEQQ
jgi:hypothetical protein